MLAPKPPLQSLASFAPPRSSNMPRKINTEAAAGFGTRLATLRKAAGITQTAFAAEIGISQRMMAYYESPAAHPPANTIWSTELCWLDEKKNCSDRLTCCAMASLNGCNTSGS